MTNKPFLSVCIPTFNRAGFLRECLASLCQDGVDKNMFEVVVSDNESSDSTVAVLEEFSNILPLRYVVQSENIGMDRNFDAVVALAQGEYCWLLGSDDAVEFYGLQKLMDALRAERTDILHFGYVQSDITLKPRFTAHPPIGRVDSKPEVLASYVGGLQNVSLMFAFISSFAFRRSVWMDQRVRVQGWVGTHYIHMFAMHAALAAGASLAAIDDCLVLARGDNPNDFNTVPGRFIALDARTVSRVIQEIHGDSKRFWQAMGRPFRRSYPIKALIQIAADGGLHYLVENRVTLIRLGYPTSLLDILAALGRFDLLKIVKLTLDLRRKAIKKFSIKAL
jgi:abequosyltransferase